MCNYVKYLWANNYFPYNAFIIFESETFLFKTLSSEIYVIVSQRDQRSATIPLLVLQTSEIPSYVLHSALRYTHTLSTALVLFFLSILLASQFAFRLQLAFSDILPIDLRMFWFLHLDFSFVCYTLVSFLLLLFLLLLTLLFLHFDFYTCCRHRLLRKKAM